MALFFTKSKDLLTPAAYYLLKTPRYCESGFLVVQYRGTGEDGPRFVDDLINEEVPQKEIEGWIQLEGR